MTFWGDEEPLVYFFLLAIHSVPGNKVSDSSVYTLSVSLRSI